MSAFSLPISPAILTDCLRRFTGRSATLLHQLSMEAADVWVAKPLTPPDPSLQEGNLPPMTDVRSRRFGGQLEPCDIFSAFKLDQ